LSSGLFEQVRSMAADLLNVPAARLTAESSPNTVEAWDSTQHLTLVLALEERFGFQLSPEEIEEMHTLGDVVRIVGSKLDSAKS
jgi:acyl carrier protein